MHSSHDNPFKPQSPLTREELDAYLKGQSDDAALRQAELKLAGDAFATEATEGLADDPNALLALPPTAVFLKQAPTPARAGGKNGLWISASIAILSTSLLIYMLATEDTPAPSANQAQVETAVKPPRETAPLFENNDASLSEIEEAQPIAEQEQITYRKAVADQPNTIIHPTPDVTAEAPKTPPVSENPPQPVAQKTEALIHSPETDPKIARSNVRFTYLHDLKVIDYSGLYTSGIPKTTFALTGTPASSENRVEAPLTSRASRDIASDHEIRTIYIPYETYLEETLLEFKHHRYKAALKNFMEIHRHYPEDLNAFFYSGLCYYNLGKFDKALSCFDRCANDSFSTFEEEAQWYKALSLIKLRKSTEAESLLRDIANSGGFYSERARQQLHLLR